MAKKKGISPIITDRIEGQRTIISTLITAESLIHDAIAIEKCKDVEEARIKKMALDAKLKIYDKIMPSARETEAERKGKYCQINIGSMDNAQLQKMVEDMGLKEEEDEEETRPTK